MALSYIMDLSGPRLGSPPSWVQRLFGKLRTSAPPNASVGQTLHGPWQLLNERQTERMNTLVPAGMAPYYGGGIPIVPDYTIRPGANLPVLPTPPPLKGALSGITDVISENPLMLVLGLGVGIWLGAKAAKK